MANSTVWRADAAGTPLPARRRLSVFTRAALALVLGLSGVAGVSVAASASSGSNAADPYTDYPPSTVVTPVAPEVTTSVCVAGQPTEPTLTLPATKGIHYAVTTGNVTNGDSVVVTATAADGTLLAEADGWTLSADATTATWSTTFVAADCPTPPPAAVATPVAPTVTRGVCTAPGEATEPTLTLASTVGLTYTMSGTVAAAGAVTVTATPSEGYTVQAAAGWTMQADGAASTVITLPAAPDCNTAPTNDSVRPEAPTLTQSQCVDGTPTQPSLTTPTSGTVTYTTAGTVTPGSTVTVTATPKPGHTLAVAPGWSPHDDGTASTQVSFEAQPDCAPKLAVTGAASSAPLALAALGVLLAGGAAIVAVRRRAVRES